MSNRWAIFWVIWVSWWIMVTATALTIDAAIAGTTCTSQRYGNTTYTYCN